jgi:hypothetical protein
MGHDSGLAAPRLRPAPQPPPATGRGLNLLAAARASEIVHEPFPHLVLRNALDADTCARLLDEWPAVETLGQGRALGNNERVSYPWRLAKADPLVSTTWKQFLAEQVGPPFLARVTQLFGPSLRQLHPRFETLCGPIDRLRSGVRGVDDGGRADVVLDAQICANTPVVQRSAVRGAHIDASNKLLVGLFYLRHPADESSGGDLQLYGPRPGWGLRSFTRPTSRGRFEVCRTIRYEHNVLVLFLNSIRSVHLVTARSPTPYPRLLVNLVGEVKAPLWHYQRWPLERLRQRLLWESAAAMPWNAEGAR